MNLTAGDGLRSTRSSIPDRLISRVELREFTDVGNTTLWRWVKEGAFPKPIRLVTGGRRYWRQSEILRWLDERSGAAA